MNQKVGLLYHSLEILTSLTGWFHSKTFPIQMHANNLTRETCRVSTLSPYPEVFHIPTILGQYRFNHARLCGAPHEKLLERKAQNVECLINPKLPSEPVSPRKTQLGLMLPAATDVYFNRSKRYFYCIFTTHMTFNL